MRMRSVLCELGFGLWRGTLFAYGEGEVFAERGMAAVRVKEGDEEREDVGEWERRPFNH